MSARIVTLGTTIHKSVQELLPWFVTEALDREQMAMVQDHVRNCAQCQSDIAWQRKFQAVYLPSNAMPDVDSAFAQLSTRLDGPLKLPKPVQKYGMLSRFLRLFSAERLQWMRWGLAVQCAIIVGLAFQLFSPLAMTPAAPSYHVLGVPSEGAGNVVVMFKPETREQDLRRILHAAGARMVDGPTVTDAYLLSVPDAQLSLVIQQLRREPAIALAESLNAGGAR
ncbi:MAG: hypothetical protein V4488_18850 [Pseudomonadota bacterium]